MLEYVFSLPIGEFLNSGFGIFLVLLAGALLGAITLLYLRKLWSAHRGRKIRKRGKKAELKAVRILKKAGYRILEREPRIECFLKVQGKRKAFMITPDYLVSKGGVTFVVEVKSHGGSHLVNQAEVRRQLVEYLYATGYPCLLVTTLDGAMTPIELIFDEKGR